MILANASRSPDNVPLTSSASLFAATEIMLELIITLHKWPVSGKPDKLLQRLENELLATFVMRSRVTPRVFGVCLQRANVDGAWAFAKISALADLEYVTTASYPGVLPATNLLKISPARTPAPSRTPRGIKTASHP